MKVAFPCLDDQIWMIMFPSIQLIPAGDLTEPLYVQTTKVIQRVKGDTLYNPSLKSPEIPVKTHLRLQILKISGQHPDLLFVIEVVTELVLCTF